MLHWPSFVGHCNQENVRPITNSPLTNSQQTASPIARMTAKSNYKMLWHFPTPTAHRTPPISAANTPPIRCRPPSLSARWPKFNAFAICAANAAGLIMLINTNVALAVAAAAVAVACCSCVHFTTTKQLYGRVPDPGIPSNPLSTLLAQQTNSK